MKSLVLFIIALTTSVTVFAQGELQVKSFQQSTNDLTARTITRKDAGGTPCALIKVIIGNQGCTFECGNIASMIVGDISFHTNEYWVYLAAGIGGAKHLKVKHPDYATIDVKFSDFGFKTLEPKTTYTLQLQRTNSDSHDLTPYVKGLPIKMKYVEGGIVGKDEGQTSHKIESFYMSETEVTVKLWKAVMGDALRENDSDNHPVTFVSWIESQKFIRKMNELTGLSFRMPSEEEWEYAARGGKDTHGYPYSGDDDVEEVACYGRADGPIDVAQKKANELGIYDMSGNVWEWCCNYSDGSIVADLCNLRENAEVVARGGSWRSGAKHCLVDSRMCQKPNNGFNLSFVGIRLVLDKTSEDAEPLGKLKCEVAANADSIVLHLNGLSIPLLHVDGGTFEMGATAEQMEFAFANEFPVHKVCLNSFFMCKEKLRIPKQLFASLGLKSSADYLDCFTYQEAHSLIDQLSKLSNLHLSLPSEAEWEYAARGGRLSKNFIYSGTNENVHESEKVKISNELHLVGMSEGSAEWTADNYSAYPNGLQTNPQVSKQGGNMVVRGGELYSGRRRVSARNQSVETKRNAIRFIIRTN